MLVHGYSLCFTLQIVQVLASRQYHISPSEDGCSCTWNADFPCLKSDGKCWGITNAEMCTIQGGQFCGNTSTCGCAKADFPCSLNGKCWGYSPGAVCESMGGTYCGTGGSGLQPSVPPPQGWAGVLRQHNIYRCMHGVPALTWTTQLQQQAQAWANQMQGVMQHGGHEGAGQNLAQLIPPTYDDVAMVRAWYDEISLTNNGLVSGFALGTGHYTQVVWRGTQQVGCAHFMRPTCNTANKPCLLVCHYFPPGNYKGQYQNNVKAPVKSYSECEGLISR